VKTYVRARLKGPTLYARVRTSLQGPALQGPRDSILVHALPLLHLQTVCGVAAPRAVCGGLRSQRPPVAAARPHKPCAQVAQRTLHKARRAAGCPADRRGVLCERISTASMNAATW